MHKQQIKLLYGVHGWSDKEVSKFIGIAESAVRMYVKEMNLTRGGGKILDMQSDGNVVPYNEPGNDISYADHMHKLKMQEAIKQLELAPIIATIELSLYSKVMDMANRYDGENPKELSEIVNTFKRLTADSMVHAAIKADENKTVNGIAANIILQMQYND